jgi:hypothetical protein
MMTGRVSNRMSLGKQQSNRTRLEWAEGRMHHIRNAVGKLFRELTFALGKVVWTVESEMQSRPFSKGTAGAVGDASA